MDNTVIKIENLSKQYRLGMIGGETLKGDIASWWAKKRGKEDPNSVIGSENVLIGQKFWALKDVDLEVKKGERLGIIGINGAGKSTLLKILSRVTAPTQGRIILNGSVASMLEVGTGFHGELTGRENIYLNGAILGMSKREIDDKIEDIIEFSECRQFIDTPVKRYSSGMYVKLAFAVAAHLDASILIMDEVLAVGDMKFQEKCLGKMSDVAEHEGKTVLYVSHNMNTIRKLCDRCIVLEKGKKIFDGAVEEAIRIYANKSVALKKYNPLKTMHPGIRKRMEFLSLEVLNTIHCEYSSDDTYEFILKFRSYENFEHAHIRFIMRWDDDTALGTFLSKEIAIKENHIHTLRVALPLRGFPDGSYYLRVTMSSVNSFGTHEDLGRCEKASYFIVKNGAERYYHLEWINWGWGAYLGEGNILEEHAEEASL